MPPKPKTRPPHLIVNIRTLSDTQAQVAVTRGYNQVVPKEDADRMQELVAQANSASTAAGYGDVMKLEVNERATTMTFRGPWDIILLFTLSELIDLAENRVAIYQAMNPHMPSISGVPEGRQ